jgi:hypothetical protein
VPQQQATTLDMTQSHAGRALMIQGYKMRSMRTNKVAGIAIQYYVTTCELSTTPNG